MDVPQRRRFTIYRRSGSGGLGPTTRVHFSMGTTDSDAKPPVQRIFNSGSTTRRRGTAPGSALHPHRPAHLRHGQSPRPGQRPDFFSRSRSANRSQRPTRRTEIQRPRVPQLAGHSHHRPGHHGQERNARDASSNEDGSADLSYGVPGVARFRVNIFRQRGSCAIVMRVIPNKIPGFEELNLPHNSAGHRAAAQRHRPRHRPHRLRQIFHPRRHPRQNE